MINISTTALLYSDDDDNVDLLFPPAICSRIVDVSSLMSTRSMEGVILLIKRRRER